MPAGDPWWGPPLQPFHQSAPCECHECTQARWKQSFQYQFEQAQAAVRPTTDGVDPFNGPELNK